MRSWWCCWMLIIQFNKRLYSLDTKNWFTLFHVVTIEHWRSADRRSSRVDISRPNKLSPMKCLRFYWYDTRPRILSNLLSFSGGTSLGFWKLELDNSFFLLDVLRTASESGKEAIQKTPKWKKNKNTEKLINSLTKPSWNSKWWWWRRWWLSR